jgi:hypothetical protein
MVTPVHRQSTRLSQRAVQPVVIINRRQPSPRLAKSTPTRLIKLLSTPPTRVIKRQSPRNDLAIRDNILYTPSLVVSIANKGRESTPTQILMESTPIKRSSPRQIKFKSSLVVSQQSSSYKITGSTSKRAKGPLIPSESFMKKMNDATTGVFGCAPAQLSTAYYRQQ